jgi:Tfp pilus assembly protein PilN
MQQQINLYQPVATSGSEAFSATMLMILVAMTCALMMAFYGILYWEKHRLQFELTALKAQFEQTSITVEKLEATVATLTDSKKDQARLKQLKNMFSSKQNALNELSTMVRGNDAGLSPYFTALARKNVESIWFEQINIYSGGQQMTLYGQTSNAKNIPDFISSLSEEEAFKGVNFKSFNITRNEKDSALHFVLQTEDAVINDQ